LVSAATTIDGNPVNNFLKREVTFNPDGVLNGASGVTIAGTYAYVCCEKGLVVVCLSDPKQPFVTSVLPMKHATSVQVQFRYAFVCSEDGITSLDVTNLARPIAKARLPLTDVHSIYLARTYAYVAAGKHGLVILNIENPEQFRVDQVYNANGHINDLHDVKLGITYVSEFAYLADGKNGMRVVQLTSPETPGNQGFSPRPTPKLIATYKIPDGGHAYSVGRALDRDRAVDESGNQIGVFGRVGAGPLSLQDAQRMYLRPNGTPWFVSDNPADGTYGEARPPR
jgi:LVIVD repeat